MQAPREQRTSFRIPGMATVRILRYNNTATHGWPFVFSYLALLVAKHRPNREMHAIVYETKRMTEVG